MSIEMFCIILLLIADIILLIALGSIKDRFEIHNKQLHSLADYTMMLGDFYVDHLDALHLLNKPGNRRNTTINNSYDRKEEDPITAFHISIAEDIIKLYKDNYSKEKNN